MLKTLYNFLHPTKSQAGLLFCPTGRSMLLIIGVTLTTIPVQKQYEIWLAPGWTKEYLVDEIDHITQYYRGWINKSEIISLNLID